MNNSSITLDQAPTTPDDTASRIREQEAKVVRIIEAIQAIAQSDAWSTLKTEVFDSLASSLRKDLYNEASKEDPDPKKLNRLAGEIKWASRYADLSKLEGVYKLDLQRIRTHQNAE